MTRNVRACGVSRYLLVCRLEDAVAAFEAEVQVRPSIPPHPPTAPSASMRAQIRPDNSDGWLSLGLSHAENDNDVAAIAALGKAVEANGGVHALLLPVFLRFPLCTHLQATTWRR